MTSETPRYLATAIDIVLRAGDMQLASFERDIRVDRKGVIDLVTDVDLAIEDMARRVLAERFPAHQMLGEERGGSTSRDNVTNEYRWIFDPIDGTTNYVHGLPIFCAALALEIRGRIDVAAVYDPTRRELFTAERGAGAFLNGRRIRVSGTAIVADAVLVTGFPYDVHEHPDEILALFGAFITRARAVRRLGSAALDLCYVAAGRMDAFWEQRLKPWDVAAATLMVEEAGGVVTGMDGSPFSLSAGHILASNGRLHDEMRRIIATCVAERSLDRTH